MKEIMLPPIDVPYTTQKTVDSFLRCRNADEAKALSPYQVGDVIPYKFGNNNVVRSLVVELIPEFHEDFGEWTPRYRVIPQNSMGSWSRSKRFTWHHYINRAYELLDDEKYEKYELT